MKTLAPNALKRACSRGSNDPRQTSSSELTRNSNTKLMTRPRTKSTENSGSCSPEPPNSGLISTALSQIAAVPPMTSRYHGQPTRHTTTLANRAFTAAGPPVARATMMAANPGIQPIRMTPQKGNANGSSPRASRTLGISSSQVSPNVRTINAAIGCRRINPSGPAAVGSKAWPRRTVWAVAVDMGRYLAGDPVSSPQGPRPSDWRPQDLAARPGQRGCAHPYSGGPAPHRSDVGTPAMVVLALFLFAVPRGDAGGDQYASSRRERAGADRR